jgi:aspartate aminotransferase
LENNRDTLLNELKEIEGVKVTIPQGTFYSFADFSRYNKDSLALSSFLLDKAYVAVVPGMSFGLEGYQRISCCAGRENILEGMRRIKWALDKDAPAELKIGDITLKKDW